MSRLSTLNEYAAHNPTLGAIPNVEMEIKLTDSKVVRHLPFPVPFKLHSAFKEEISRLLKMGIITESKSNYSCPAFVILKSNGTIRLIVNYRAINRITVPESYPFPDLWKEIRSLPPSTIFSQIDLIVVGKRYR
ncbi:hypothetical protein ENBRE01_3161 [Enteropsectra breve]|nr:hypothetical protein ENBRE01_3161 [Enteropsectra breve]